MRRIWASFLVLAGILLISSLIFAMGMGSKWPQGWDVIYMTLLSMAAIGSMILGIGYGSNIRRTIVIGALLLGNAAVGLMTIIIIIRFMKSYNRILRGSELKKAACWVRKGFTKRPFSPGAHRRVRSYHRLAVVASRP
jgi:hypothetical protein